MGDTAICVLIPEDINQPLREIHLNTETYYDEYAFNNYLTFVSPYLPSSSLPFVAIIFSLIIGLRVCWMLRMLRILKFLGGKMYMCILIPRNFNSSKHLL